jgi:hypothetical protein
MRAQIAACSGRFALNREIHVCAGLVVGLGGLELPTKRKDYQPLAASPASSGLFALNEEILV